MATTNFPGGFTNAQPDSTMGEYVKADFSNIHELLDDFDQVSTGTSGQRWLATKVGTTPTTVSASVDGGAILITNSAGATDSCFLQWMGSNAGTVAETFSFEAGRRTWFKTRFKVSDATLSALVFGMQITDTTPLAVSDGVYFLKPSGAATLNFISAASSVLTTTSAVATLANDTWANFAFYYNGVDSINIFVNDVKVGRQDITTLPSHTLALSFGIQNGEAVGKTMTMDYIYASEERAFP
jgi:hypothetical protein